MNYRKKSCEACGEDYSPTGGRQRICAACRDGQATGANCSSCGSLVSDRTRWGLRYLNAASFLKACS